jgi:cytochrome c
MKSRPRLATAAGRSLGLAVLLAACQAGAADLDHGKQVFAACAACHTEKPDALGPSLKGVLGRKSAALGDFRYSGPMRRANLVWDEVTLRQFVADPQAKVPGTRMPFDGIRDAKDVDDVVAYLATLK